VNRTLKFQARRIEATEPSAGCAGCSTAPPTPVRPVRRTSAYTKAGLLATRTETAADQTRLTSRYYGYDSLLRLTCEARGSRDDPSDRGRLQRFVKKLKMGGLFTYHDGASATAAARRAQRGAHQARLTTTPSTGDVQSTYAVVARDKVQTFTRDAAGTNTMVLGHDALGRRSFEYDAFDAGP
jgi:hypothetical protein